MAAGRSSRELSTRVAQSARERVVAVVPVVVECYPVPPPRSDCVCMCVCMCTYPSRSRREKKKKKNVLIEARRRRAPTDKDRKKNEGCCLTLDQKSRLKTGPCDDESLRKCPAKPPSIHYLRIPPNVVLRYYPYLQWVSIREYLIHYSRTTAYLTIAATANDRLRKYK